uniref:Rho GTPase-activating protein 39 n=1 Tax=Cacopsylla melanoneura TaxID=428564 RepID=A0A8D8VTW1_9HEMI
MSNERMEWVEIIEPKTQEHMYANLSTGECVWDLPNGVPVKKRDDNQWWELFDHNTTRFYYYNATTQKTVWHRPSNCDIIPLAKLQTLKQHAEAIPSSDAEDSAPAPTPTPRETVSTQTSTSDKNHTTTTSNDSHSIKTNHVSNKSGGRERGEDGAPPAATHHRPLPHNKNMVTCQTQTSPLSPRRSHHNHNHHHHHCKDKQGGTRRGSSTKPVQSQDSGRSSDSNCSSSVHRTPSSALSTPDTPSSISLSTSTPLLKKKTLGDSSAGGNIPTPAPRAIQRSSSNATASSIPKQKSFDHNISIGGGYSLGHENRCGSMSRTPKPAHNNKPSSGSATSISRSQSFAQGGGPPSHHRDREFHLSSRGGERPLQHASRGGGGGEEEDSMHEKYFLGGGGKKSVESTPQTRRKHLTQLSSSQPPTHHTHSHPPSTPDYVNFLTTNNPPPPSSYHSRSSSNSSTMQTSNSSYPHPPSNKSTPPSTNSVTSYPPVSGYQKSPSISNNKLSSRLKESGLSSTDDDDRSSSLSLSSSPPTAATPPRRITNMKPSLHAPIHLSDTNLDLSIPNSRPPSSELRSHPSSDRVSSSSKHMNNDTTTTNMSRHNNNDRSPLYTNTSLASTDEHLLPLHQYILEQAKLSGCYRFGEPVTAEEGTRFRGSRRGGGSEDEDLLGGVGGLRVEYDSDEFADDEAMSNAEEDSSSQEYLDDEPSEYLHEEYARRFHATPGSNVWNYSSPAGDGGRVCDYRVESVDDGSGASSHYYNTTASLLPPHRMGGANHHILPITGPLGVPQETQHASLKRKKDPLPLQTHHMSSILEARSEQQMQRVPSWQPPSRDQLDMGRFTPLPAPECDVGYAPDNLNIHKKGIFRKNLSVKDMLSWSVDPISQPMTVLADKTLKKEARDLFKLVQIYMGDRKTKVGMSLNSVALEICTLGYTKPQLRDELYIQICKQTSENPKRESLRRGWELMAICLAFFPPSPNLQSYLDGYMNRHRNPNYDFPEVGKWPIHIQVSHYASIACKRLERGGMGGKRQARKPSVDEIEQARLQIFRPSMFGGTLAEVMSLQRDKFPHHRLPWIQTTLSEQVLRLGGKQTEGIFRVSADMDEVNCLKIMLDQWKLPQEPLLDAHTPASLLKLWYRELYEPLIPDSLYAECVTHCESPCIVLSLVDKLPELNKLVLCYLVHFLQMFAKQDVVQMTKMDANNLAMVMAPNCLRCTSSDPCVIFDNARKEMAFMRTLIQHLDTRFIHDEQVF